jgi:hypothetical protein
LSLGILNFTGLFGLFQYFPLSYLRRGLIKKTIFI